ncbi:MAG: hypothetical protein JWQ38_3168 [Flavipsychrobacter sp.]|nr:hypothetical protein [Flavipsychrobacter sp.]
MNMTTRRTLISSLSILMLSVPSCKKKEAGNQTATVYFDIQSNIEGNKITYGSFMHDSMSGYIFSITNAQCFISGITLSNANGSSYTIPDAHLLVSPGGMIYLAGTAPIGTYNNISFNVGLDAATNALAPYIFAPSGYERSSSMWYGSTTKGYNFIRLQGVYTTDGTSGTAKNGFSFDIGAAANGLLKVSLPVRGGDQIPSFKPYILTAGNTQHVHLICDYGKILERITYPNKPQGDTTDTYTINHALSLYLSAGASTMFRYAD